ncbi:hypothetical protein [Sphingorhabdus sp. M41]|uniref:hypothetical protein n=1 Tax=Sphingorhabdus sp. M41 TaxID=1806885 RepID=UPI0012E94965|nr:hypothetical protein [Sphingorhabdus sp. M41]
MAELRVPRQRAFLQDFITRSREAAKKVRLADDLRAFAASRGTDGGHFSFRAFGG